MADIIAVAHTLAQTLERLGIVYWIGGSMASAIHGVPRSTQDVDFVAELKEEQVDDLVAALESEFYTESEQQKTSYHHTLTVNSYFFAYE